MNREDSIIAYVWGPMLRDRCRIGPASKQPVPRPARMVLAAGASGAAPAEQKPDSWRTLARPAVCPRLWQTRESASPRSAASGPLQERAPLTDRCPGRRCERTELRRARATRACRGAIRHPAVLRRESGGGAGYGALLRDAEAQAEGGGGAGRHCRGGRRGVRGAGERWRRRKSR